MTPPFTIGRVFASAFQFLRSVWWQVLCAFVLLSAIPRAIIGEDIDQGWLGNGVSILVNTIVLPGFWRAGAIEALIEIPHFIFLITAMMIMARAAKIRVSWPSAGTATLFLLLIWLLKQAFNQSIIGLTVQPIILWVLFTHAVPFVLDMLLLSSVAAILAEQRNPLSGFWRGLQLSRGTIWRLILIQIALGSALLVCRTGESLMLQMVPVTDGTAFDWITTILQECISGASLPIVAAIWLSCYRHLQWRREGVPTEQIVSVFD